MSSTPKARSLFDAQIVRGALVASLRKLDPRHQVRNSVMFTVFVGSVLTTGLGVHALASPVALAPGETPGFIFGISAWLWFTVLFANFAEAMAEGRGKAQADSLRQARRDVVAKKLDEPSVAELARVRGSGPRTLASSATWRHRPVQASALRKGDVVLVEAGDMIPADGEVVEGVASVDESAITGESAPVKDIVKGGIKERFAELRRMGIKTVMITGDNPLTAAAIAAEAGVDDFLAQATPEAKLKMIRDYQAGGRLVAMTGDGTNDSPALAQADVAVAMNSGTQAAKEAGNMVDLDSNPTKLIEIVEIGKQLLITRGALTTFSLANDVAKYFAIIPAAFAGIYPVLDALNVMRLATPASAILSAVIFNALIIVALIPLALKGVQYRAVGAARLLRENLLIYGLGGLVVPFVGVKLIDLVLVGLGLA